MPVSDYSTTPSDNTSISGQTVTDSTRADAVDNILRQMMADTREFYDETPRKTENATVSGDWTFTGNVNLPRIEIDITSAVASQAVDIPWQVFRIDLWSFLPSVADTQLVIQFGANGQAGAFETGLVYFNHLSRTADLSEIAPSATVDAGVLASVPNDNTGVAANSTVEVRGFNEASQLPTGKLSLAGRNSSATLLKREGAFRVTGGSEANYNAIRFIPGSGNISTLKAIITGIA